MERSETSRGVALVISAVGVAAGIAGLITGLVYLRIRPPCPAGYVRLLDVARAVPWASAFLAFAAGSCLLSSLPLGRHRLVVATSGAVTAVSVGVLVVTTVSLVHSHSVGTCWAS